MAENECIATIQTVDSAQVYIKERYSDTIGLATSILGQVLLGTIRGTKRKKEVIKLCVKDTKQQFADRVAENPRMEIEFMQKICSVEHPHFVSFIDAVEDKKLYCICLEYVSGGDMCTYLQNLRCGLANEQAIKYTVQLAKAVYFMHENGYCHLDLSLENVLLDKKKDVVKICDFGLCRRFPNGDSSALFPAATIRPGKKGYMAPEVYAYQRFNGEKADVFSLGVLIFILLTGFPPFTTPNASDKCFQYMYYGKLEWLLKQWKLNDIINAQCRDLLSKIFCHPKKRITVKEMLQHPWLNQNIYEIDAEILAFQMASTSMAQPVSPVNSQQSESEAGCVTTDGTDKASLRTKPSSPPPAATIPPSSTPSQTTSASISASSAASSSPSICTSASISTSTSSLPTKKRKSITTIVKKKRLSKSKKPANQQQRESTSSSSSSTSSNTAATATATRGTSSRQEQASKVSTNSNVANSASKGRRRPKSKSIALINFGRLTIDESDTLLSDVEAVVVSSPRSREQPRSDHDHKREYKKSTRSRSLSYSKHYAMPYSLDGLRSKHSASNHNKHTTTTNAKQIRHGSVSSIREDSPASTMSNHSNHSRHSTNSDDCKSSAASQHSKVVRRKTRTKSESQSNANMRDEAGTANHASSVIMIDGQPVRLTDTAMISKKLASSNQNTSDNNNSSNNDDDEFDNDDRKEGDYETYAYHERNSVVSHDSEEERRFSITSQDAGHANSPHLDYCTTSKPSDAPLELPDDANPDTEPAIAANNATSTAASSSSSPSHPPV
eukprot:CAMPEP_0197076588 /NCGR_PEP_ID=MMETSP1384-20130603/212189_1 /TAXON_ID=29189 /ORGANISM="Ammonia sp." /LENGTH=783 /DNA_ID=CAMNT_0042515447 /DNA_START=240 /DNA_END=2591 /DNA_ORIENTATION=-